MLDIIINKLNLCVICVAAPVKYKDFCSGEPLKDHNSSFENLKYINNVCKSFLYAECMLIIV